jgi:hypothetical protein
VKSPVSILFGWVWTVWTAYACGRLLLKWARLPLSRAEHHLLSLAAGAPVLSLAVFTLGAFHLWYDPAFWLTGIGATLMAWKQGAFRLETSEPLPPLPKGWRVLFFAVFTPFCVAGFLHALAPEWSPDGSGYHLGVIGHYYRAHGFIPLLSNMYAHLSQGLEMLFLHAYALGRHSSAALVHFAFAVCGSLLMVSWGRRQGRPGVGVAGALFFFCSPVVLVDAASAYNDAALACILFSVFYVSEIMAPGPRAAAVLGILAGFAFGVKFTAFLAVPYAAVRLGWRLRNQRLPWLRPALAFAAGACLMAAPWMLKNAWYTGSPVAPLFSRWIPNAVMRPSFEADYQESMRKYPGIDSYADLPLELTVRGQILGGFLGPLFLGAPLGLLALRHPAGRRVVAAAILFALPYAANVGTRFLIPALPFVSLALAGSMPAALLPVLVVVHGAASFPDVPATYVKEHAWRIARLPWRQAWRQESEESYLWRRFPGYRVARMVERATPKGAVVYSMSPVPDAYTTREVWTSFQSAQGDLLRDATLMPFITDFTPVERHSFRFPARALEAVRAFQVAPRGPTDQYSIHEMHLLRRGLRLVRSREWRIRAWPNPAEVGYVFDNSPVPRWRSWRRLEPGMFVEVRFPQVEAIDQVDLDVPVDHRASRTVIEGRVAGSAAWVRLADNPEVTGLPVPLGLRRMATRELKARGIDYLLIQPGNFQEEDFLVNANLWGIRQVDEVDGARLFKIE